MSRRVAGAVIGIVFGVTLSWSGMTSPVVIRQALLFEKSYLFLFMASAVATAALGLQLLKRRERRALLADTQLTWPRERIGRRHIVGSVIFGVGWGVADACPGPVATQVGQGIAWGVVTLVGVVIGVYAFLRMGRRETEPAAQPAPAQAPSRSPQAAAV
jgi:uncharacterized membrane protein YedE/YeeE